jgi:hypothetical protein
LSQKPEAGTKAEPNEVLLPSEDHCLSYDPRERVLVADHRQCFVLPEISTDLAEMTDLYQFALGMERDVSGTGPAVLNDSRSHVSCDAPHYFESLWSSEPPSIASIEVRLAKGREAKIHHESRAGPQAEVPARDEPKLDALLSSVEAPLAGDCVGLIESDAKCYNSGYGT